MCVQHTIQSRPSLVSPRPGAIASGTTNSRTLRPLPRTNTAMARAVSVISHRRHVVASRPNEGIRNDARMRQSHRHTRIRMVNYLATSGRMTHNKYRHVIPPSHAFRDLETGPVDFLPEACPLPFTIVRPFTVDPFAWLMTPLAVSTDGISILLISIAARVAVSLRFRPCRPVFLYVAK